MNRIVLASFVLLFCCFGVSRAESTAVIVITDSRDPTISRLADRLQLDLMRLRIRSAFVGVSGLASHFLLRLDSGVEAERKWIQAHGVQPPRVLICRVDRNGVPKKVLWERQIESTAPALRGVMEALGAEGFERLAEFNDGRLLDSEGRLIEWLKGDSGILCRYHRSGKVSEMLKWANGVLVSRQAFRYGSDDVILSGTKSGVGEFQLSYDGSDRIKTLRVDSPRTDLSFTYGPNGKPTRIEILKGGVRSSIHVEYGADGEIKHSRSEGGHKTALAVTEAFGKLNSIVKIDYDLGNGIAPDPKL